MEIIPVLHRCFGCGKWHLGDTHECLSTSKDKPHKPDSRKTDAVFNDEFTTTRAAVMHQLHEQFWINNVLEVVAKDVEFQFAIQNPDTGKVSTTAQRAGKVNRIVRLHDESLAVYIHFIADEDIRATARFWKKIDCDGNLTDSVLAMRKAGFCVSSVLCDVVRMPNLRPGKNETPEEYGRRIYETVAADPQRYFRREEITRPEHDLLDYERRLWSLWTTNGGASKI